MVFIEILLIQDIGRVSSLEERKERPGTHGTPLPRRPSLFGNGRRSNDCRLSEIATGGKTHSQHQDKCADNEAARRQFAAALDGCIDGLQGLNRPFQLSAVVDDGLTELFGDVFNLYDAFDDGKIDLGFFKRILLRLPPDFVTGCRLSGDAASRGRTPVP